MEGVRHYSDGLAIYWSLEEVLWNGFGGGIDLIYLKLSIEPMVNEVQTDIQYYQILASEVAYYANAGFLVIEKARVEEQVFGARGIAANPGALRTILTGHYALE